MGEKLKQITDLKITSLRQIKDERGAVFHYLRKDSPNYHGFGEAYFSKINGGIIKGWKLHYKVVQNFCVPYGAVKLVIYDARVDSNSYGSIQEIILDDDANFKLLTLPPNLWYSFKSLSKDFSLMANITTLTHSIGETTTLELGSNDIPYVWK